MQQIIITDIITHPNGLATLAGIHPPSGKSVKLSPDLSAEQLQTHRISIGSILDCKLEAPVSLQCPGFTYSFSDFNNAGTFPRHGLHKLLKSDSISNLHRLFQIPQHLSPTHIPPHFEDLPVKPLYTLRILPYTLSLQHQANNARQLCATFSDGEGCSYKDLPIRDPRFSENHLQRKGLRAIEKKLQLATELYLRIGIHPTNCSQRRGEFHINSIHSFEMGLKS